MFVRDCKWRSHRRISQNFYGINRKTLTDLAMQRQSLLPLTLAIIPQAMNQMLRWSIMASTCNKEYLQRASKFPFWKLRMMFITIFLRFVGWYKEGSNYELSNDYWFFFYSRIIFLLSFVLLAFFGCSLILWMIPNQSHDVRCKIERQNYLMKEFLLKGCAETHSQQIHHETPFNHQSQPKDRHGGVDSTEESSH